MREGRHGGGIALYLKYIIPRNTVKSNGLPTDDLEILRVAARSRWLPREICVLVICGIYVPPSAPSQDTLRERTTENVFSLQAEYENPFFIIFDDLNAFPFSHL